MRRPLPYWRIAGSPVAPCHRPIISDRRGTGCITRGAALCARHAAFDFACLSHDECRTEDDGRPRSSRAVISSSLARTVECLRREGKSPVPDSGQFVTRVTRASYGAHCE